jgi:hypothetical protein
MFHLAAGRAVSDICSSHRSIAALTKTIEKGGDFSVFYFIRGISYADKQVLSASAPGS